MKRIEFGKQNTEVILLLHGGGLSWWNYREVAEILQDKYHVVLPILDGHSKSDRDFTSIEDNAREIIDYIDKEHGGSVLLIGGLSLGAQILVEMLSQSSDICEHAMIESALVIPMKMTNLMTKSMLDMSYGLIAKEWFAKLQFQSLGIKADLYEDYYKDSSNISKENMIAFLKANSAYEVKDTLGKTRAKVHICVGQREQGIMIRSARKLHELIPGSTLDILPKLYHGEYSINHAKEYADKVRALVEVF